MSLITLSELALIKQQTEFNPEYSFHTINTPNLQQQIKLIIQQKRLGLPLDSILANQPLLKQWLAEIETHIPSIFEPQKKLFLNLPILAKLAINVNQYYIIEIEINLGISRGKILLFEWGIRQPGINWQDRVKLWATSQYLEIEPRTLKLLILALNMEQPLTSTVINWSKIEQEETQEWLLQLLTNKPQKPEFKPESSPVINLDAIEEIAI
jgi:hypothetical protein